MFFTERWTAGKRLRNRMMTSGNPRASTATPKPTRSMPASPCSARRVMRSVASASATSKRACCKKRSPAGVRCSPLDRRMSKAPPRRSSRRRTCLLSAGCEMFSDSAVRPKWRSSHNAMKDRISDSSSAITTGYQERSFDSLDRPAFALQTLRRSKQASRAF